MLILDKPSCVSAIQAKLDCTQLAVALLYEKIAAEAFERHGRPEIFNTDQGSQFTSDVFIGTLVGDNP